MTKKLLDKPTPTVNDLAKKYGVSVLQVKKQLLKGIKVEKEHTDHPKIAREIALDHLGEKLDYYTKLDKAHLEEETGTAGVRGLGYVTGDPGIDPVSQYITTNAMSYEDENGNKLDYIKKQHADLHNKGLGFNFFDPTKTKTASNFMHEETNTSVGMGGDHSPKSEGDKYLDNNVKGTERDADIREKHADGVHHSLHADHGFNTFRHTNVKSHSNKELKEAREKVTKKLDELGLQLGKLNELGGNIGYEGISDAPPKGRTNDQQEETVTEDLRKWFKQKWVRYDTKGNIKGPCARDEGEGKPKCRPLASARAMSKDERAKSARRKRREDPVANRPGKGGKPIMVKTNEETLLEKNVPTNPELWAKAKAQAKAKFDVYPSAYANGWASKWYKSKGGGWKSAANESVDIEETAAWTRSAGKDPEGGLNRKGIASYRAQHPGSHLSMAVTKKPSELDPDGKAAKRRKSFCARMGGMKGPMKDEKGRPTRKALALRKWNCEEENKYPQTAERGIYEMDTDSMPTSKNIEDRRPSLVSSMWQAAHNATTSGLKSGEFKDVASMQAKASDAVKKAASDYFSRTNRDNSVLDKKDYKQMNEDWQNELAHPDFVHTVSREANLSNPKSVDAVLHVMHNRMRSGQYASSPLGVVRQKGQFDAYGKGPAKGFTDQHREMILNRAKSIFSGSEKDITGGANEFRTTSGRNRPGGTVIGGNTFYKTGSFAKAKTSAPAPTQAPTQVASAPKPQEAPKPTQVATSAPSPTPTSTPSPSGYSVQKGDTLSSIAKRYNTDVGSLAKSSGISNPDKIAIGQNIKIPEKPSQVASINEISAELVGRVSNKRFWRGEAPSKTLTRAINKKYAEGDKKEKETPKKQVKENSKDKDWDDAVGFMGKGDVAEQKHRTEPSHVHLNKPDVKYAPGATGVTHTIHEETTMENENLVNEAIENILENDLVSMKENLMIALQEKAQEKLEERKKEIAANYFAQ